MSLIDDLIGLGNALPPSHQANPSGVLPLLSALIAEQEFPGILAAHEAGRDLHSILGGDAYQAPPATEAEQAAQAADLELDAAKARIAELEAAAAGTAQTPPAPVINIADLQAEQAAQIAAAAAAATTVETVAAPPEATAGA